MGNFLVTNLILIFCTFNDLHKVLCCLGFILILQEEKNESEGILGNSRIKEEFKVPKSKQYEGGRVKHCKIMDPQL